jgi:hypothetical protein
MKDNADAEPRVSWREAQEAIKLLLDLSLAEEDLSLLPTVPADPTREHKFVRAYENPRFVSGKGQPAVPTQVAQLPTTQGRQVAKARIELELDVNSGQIAVVSHKTS